MIDLVKNYLDIHKSMNQLQNNHSDNNPIKNLKLLRLKKELKYAKSQLDLNDLAFNKMYNPEFKNNPELYITTTTHLYDRMH